MAEDEWVVEYDEHEAVEALHQALFRVDQEAAGEMAATAFLVDRFAGLRVEVFVREYSPPHFRVSCQRLAATFTIRDCSPLKGDLGRYQRVIRAWHEQNKPRLIETWNRLRPSDCPVGKYEDA